MPTRVTIDAPQYYRGGSLLWASTEWSITFDSDGQLHTGQTSCGLLPSADGHDKDGVLLALAKEVHRLRNEVANHETHADVTPDGSLVRVGAYEIHGEPGRVTLYDDCSRPSFDRTSVEYALQQAAREIRRLRGAPPAAVTSFVIPRQSRNPFDVLTTF